MAMVSRSALPLQLLRYASTHYRLGALYRPLPSSRVQLNAAASSYQEAAAGNQGITAAAGTCAPVEVDYAAMDQQLGKKKRGALPDPQEGRPSLPIEDNHKETNHSMSLSNASPLGFGTPVEGHGGDGGYHH